MLKNFNQQGELLLETNTQYLNKSDYRRLQKKERGHDAESTRKS